MISTNQSGQTFPGLTLKAWAHVKSDGTLLKGFNVASVSRGGVGTFTVTYTTAMSTANAMVKIQAQPFGATRNAFGSRTNQLAASVNITIYNDTSAPSDFDFYVEVWE